LPYGGPAA